MKKYLYTCLMLLGCLTADALDFGDIPANTDVSTLWAASAFKTISISGQSDVVADGTADTLTLVAGSGVTLTTNASTDTITIAASGGSTSPLTTKGDLWGFTTVDARLAVGADGKILAADSGQSAGLGYSTRDLDAATHKIANVTDPSSAQDVATKNYVDTHSSPGGGLSCTTSQVTGSDFTTTSSSLVDITGLTYAAAANTLYEVEVVHMASNSATNSCSFSVAFSAAGATGQVGTIGPTSSINTWSTSGAALGSQNNGLVQYSGTNSLVYERAVVLTGVNTGNITAQALRNVSGTLTIRQGSRMTVCVMH